MNTNEDGPGEGPRDVTRDDVESAREVSPVESVHRTRWAGRRVYSALRGSGRAQFTVALLLALLGFAMVTQVKSNGANDTYSGLRSADLVQVLNGLNAESRRADTEIANLEKTRAQLTDSTQRRAAALKRAREQTATLGILAGTLPAVGPGIRIEVTDPNDKVTLNNLLDGVEELRAAGAEAVEFNDSVRVIAQTSFEDADRGVVIDGKRIAAPYVIDVIGDPDTLAGALDFADGFSYDVKASDGTVDVRKLDKVKITTVVRPVTPKYAAPVSGQ